MNLLSGLANALNPMTSLEQAIGAVGSLTSGGNNNPLSMIESLFGGGGGDSIASGQGASQGGSGASSLMSIVSLAAMFL